jgi:hypothetical protein
MAERHLIVAEIKRALRECQLTYTQVASKLKLSLASVKRLFATGDLSLERVESICELVGLTLKDILERAHQRGAPTRQLTPTQERELVADPELLFIGWLVLNRMPVEEIVREYRLTEGEVLRLLIRLDRLKVIELQPGNRVRLLINRQFGWRPGGPVQQYIHEKLLGEFFASPFDGPRDEIFFHGCPVSGDAQEQLRHVLQKASRECMQIVERERSPREARHGVAFVLALRRWKYSGFSQFDRK